MADPSTNGHADADSNSDSDEKQLTSNEFDAGLRAGLAAALGHSGFDDRDVYEAFGWEKDPDEDVLFSLYLRNPIARTVVDKPAATTWRRTPQVVDGGTDDIDEDPEPQTEFEQAIKTLARERNLWDYQSRVDHLAGVGHMGLLVFDLADTNDPSDFAEPVNLSGEAAGLDALRGFRVYPEVQIDDIDWGKPGDERWGKPTSYQIDLGEDIDEETGDESGTLTVHWERAIAVPATRLLDDETQSRPRVEPVLNAITDTEKILGAVAELAYRGADYGLHINLDPEKVDTGGDAVDLVNDEAERFSHGLSQIMKTVGADVERLGGEIADPSGIIDPYLDLISMQSRIPKTELLGASAGELASATEDRRRYFGVIRERQRQYAEPHITRALIDRLREFGILPEPEDDTYAVVWPDLTEVSDQEHADIKETRSTVVKNLRDIVPELRGERAEEFIETGVFPERAPEANESPLDESDRRIQQGFAMLNQATADD